MIITENIDPPHVFAGVKHRERLKNDLDRQVDRHEDAVKSPAFEILRGMGASAIISVLYDFERHQEYEKGEHSLDPEHLEWRLSILNTVSDDLRLPKPTMPLIVGSTIDDVARAVRVWGYEEGFLH